MDTIDLFTQATRKITIKKQVGHVNFYMTKDTEWTNKTTARILWEGRSTGICAETYNFWYIKPMAVCVLASHLWSKSTVFKTLQNRDILINT